MEIMFLPYENAAGYAVVTPKGSQAQATAHCKEVFARNLKKAQADEAGLVRFLRKDPHTKSKDLARHQQKIVRCFENAMGIKPPATVEIVQRVAPADKPWLKTDTFFLYTVSADWRKNLPLSHILALITRHYYPLDGEIEWKTILTHLNKKRAIGAAARDVAHEIVTEKGEILAGIVNNGITDYAWNLERFRNKKPQDLNRENPDVVRFR